MAFNSLLKGELLKDNVNLAVLKLEGIEFRDLKFPAEESYRGGWKESRVRRAGSVVWVPPAATRRHPPPPACTSVSLAGLPACTSTAASPLCPVPTSRAARGRGLLHLGRRQHV